MSNKAFKLTKEQSKSLGDISTSSSILSPTVQDDYKGAPAPFYSTGSRALIRVGGQAVGVAQSFTWKVSYNGTPVNTVDSVEAWDIDVGRLVISGTLTKIIDPTTGPEGEGLFHIMKAAVHQPMVEIQALDALGTSLFFSRGMFLAVEGNVARGQLSGMTAQFIGIGFQHYISQGFQAYDSVSGKAETITKNLRGLISNVSGGIL